MSDTPSNLDEHRGMMAQKATELRRLTAAVMADQAALEQRRHALEQMLAAQPAANWHELAEKMRYLLLLFSEAAIGQDARRRALIEQVRTDLDRLDTEAAY